MITLHAEILKENGKNKFAILPFKEYSKLVEYAENLEDLLDLRKAKKANQNEKTFSLDEVIAKLDIKE